MRHIKESLTDFLSATGLDEEPMGLFFSDDKPEEGMSPEPTDLPTIEKERANQVDWKAVFGSFSCSIGHIWRARKKKKAAYFSKAAFGCPGAAFWMGFNKPQVETIIKYVSTGIPGWMEGEMYCESTDDLRRAFEYVDPFPVPKKYLIVKPLSQFLDNEIPEVIIFFTRPEPLCGLHQLAFFVTNDPEVVASPWGAACGGIASWPLHYRAKGIEKAVIGGWDPSSRKFYKTDELTFTVPFTMFEKMIARYKESFLSKKVWNTVLKKAERSKKAWGEA